MSPPTDLELLSAWREGGAQAGDELLGRHFPSIYRFFRRKVSNADVARELSQATFLSCVESRDRLRDGGRFRAFLFGIARNHLLRHIRSAKREDLPVDPEPSLTSPSGALALKQEERLLLLALRRLPLDLQLTIELHYWEGMKMTEIAEVLEVAAGTIKWRLSKAREALRASIESMEASRSLIESTVNGLDTWARAMRKKVDAED